MQILSAFNVTKNFKGVLLDAYGVFWGGNETGLLPGSKEAMENLVANGKVVGILSNSTQLAEKEIHKLSTHGVSAGRHFHFLITSGELARNVFLNKELPFPTPHRQYWVFGQDHPRFSPHQAIFEGTSYVETRKIEEADFVYISIPHLKGEDQQDPEVFLAEIKKIKKWNLPFVCANPDRFAHEGKPARIVARQGSIAHLYEKMGGRIFYIGKPYEIAYREAYRHFQKWSIANLNEILMIGDTPETDIRGAKSFGLPSALVTKTGIMAEKAAACGLGIHGLEAALKNIETRDLPDFFLGSFSNL